jgi:hypothetical protein
MKSKRQEELPKKTLSQPTAGWPEFFQQHATRILLGLSLVVLAVMVIRYRNASAEQRQATARAAAVRARADLQQLRQELQLSAAPPEQLAMARDQLTSQIMAELSEALADSGDADTTVRADAYAIRGDLYWTLANAPVFTEATTRPFLATKESPDALLTEAEADYRHIIEQYPTELMDWATAEFGLAAIAENRSNWDDARKHYEEVENAPNSPEMLKSAAQIRMTLLERIRQPVLVGPYPTTAPTTSPALAAATTAPATLPLIPPATSPSR